MWFLNGSQKQCPKKLNCLIRISAQKEREVGGGWHKLNSSWRPEHSYLLIRLDTRQQSSPGKPHNAIQSQRLWGNLVLQIKYIYLEWSQATNRWPLIWPSPRAFLDTLPAPSFAWMAPEDLSSYLPWLFAYMHSSHAALYLCISQLPTRHKLPVGWAYVLLILLSPAPHEYSKTLM
jgi:hypothetical protein